VNGEVGKSEREDRLFRRHCEAHRSHHRQGHATDGAKRKERPSDQAKAHRAQQARKADKGPESDERKTGAQR
jgi:hypothetical protein